MNNNMKRFLNIFKGRKAIRLGLAFVLFWTPIIVFVKLADEVLENEPIHIEIVLLNYIHSLSTPFLDGFFLFITTIGNVESILPITILILAYIIYRKQRLNALIVLFGVGGAALANFLLKLIFHRDRPAFWQSAITETGYSFPSGHAMVSCALVLCLIVILWNTKWRLTAIIAGASTIILIGLSRLYMGVHYPTDVLAGWSVSIAWVLIVTVIAKGLSNRFRKKLAVSEAH
ncbi:MAG: acid phosphatase [Candidatus Saccharibacteria bacterium]|nr:acid phosphatase [Candidatus Saccharibacteria bacterium]MDB5180733.1 acid phosphatase [Candidatus Saccharibacteria bacterium]